MTLIIIVSTRIVTLCFYFGGYLKVGLGDKTICIHDDNIMITSALAYCDNHTNNS